VSGGPDHVPELLAGDTANKHIEKAKLIADRILPKPVDANVLLREIDALLASDRDPAVR
jgi:hypothetical protein